MPNQDPPGDNNAASSEMPWYVTVALVVLTVVTIARSRGTPSPSPFEPSWESLRGQTLEEPADTRDSHPRRPAPMPAVRPAAGAITADDLILHRRTLLPDPAPMFATGCDETWRWELTGYSRNDLEAFLSEALDAPHRSEARAAATCDARGCTIVASTPLLEGLSPTERERVYSALEPLDANQQTAEGFRRTAADGPFSAMAEMPALAAPLVARSEFAAHGGWWLIDSAAVCARLPRSEDRAALFRALHAVTTVDAELKLPISDARLAASFDPVDRSRVRALLAAAQERNQTSIPLAELMPEAARPRLDRFPDEAQGSTNCFAAAMAFRRSTVEAPLVIAELIAQRLRDGYREVPDRDVRFGDMVVFYDAGGVFHHAVNYLLGSLVLTKNGATRLQPWQVMPLEDLRLFYPRISAARVFRPNENPGAL